MIWKKTQALICSGVGSAVQGGAADHLPGGGDRAVAEAAGCDDYDTKPVELPCLTASPAARLRRDLRTPVNHILGYGEMLLEDAEATGRAGRAASLARILDLAREMIVVIDGPATVRQLGDSFRAPARRTIAELERLQDSGTSLGAAEAADLRHIADVARKPVAVRRLDGTARIVVPAMVPAMVLTATRTKPGERSELK
jgi:hypothetical protein